ncbi:hypothetical protein B0H65DRAFT_560176 [Neurospora tetraspora]|uniref:Uncharacterized protein n=1 Tax=Neurospora tetraspora TaxID=94610 RepID=A0AAE0MPI4_9PEZI|nr:hypothetical protein B0H65DRAFT_560176 [Neurospora tetraspora]
MSDSILKGFVPAMEAAVHQRNPHLKEWWRIILYIQEHIAQPGDRAVLSLAVIKRQKGLAWEDRYDEFARHAYEYLEFGYRMGASEQFIKRIAWTKPNIRHDAFKDMNSHELSLARRPKKGEDEADQAYDARMKTEGEFWVHQEVLFSHTSKRMPIETLRDIPCYSDDECHFVKLMVEAIVDMDGEKDGNIHQIDAVKKASKGVIQHLAWVLMQEAKLAQAGRPGIAPFCTSFYLREYESFWDRWDDMTALFKVSKAAVANLLITPYFKRFACDPHTELQRKEGNAHNNETKAMKARDGQAALAAQASGSGAANHH